MADEKTTKPLRKQHPISAENYAKISGHKPDQTAGFLSWATARKLGRRTKRDWDVIWAEFQKKPA